MPLNPDSSPQSLPTTERPATGAKTLVVGAAILDSLVHPQLLLCAQRAYPPTLAGQWELPGGKVQPGETPRQALERELSEEIGFLGPIQLADSLPGPPLKPPAFRSPAAAPKSQPSLTPQTYWPLTATLEMLVYLGQPSGWQAGETSTNSLMSAPPGNNHLQLRWIPLTRLFNLDWLPGDVAPLHALLSWARQNDHHAPQPQAPNPQATRR